METYQVGDRPTVTAYFTTIDTGDPANPTAITVRVRKPDGTVTTYDQTNCTNPETGTWKFAFPFSIDQTGKWSVKFQGTATVIAADTISFAVECDEFDT